MKIKKHIKYLVILFTTVNIILGKIPDEPIPYSQIHKPEPLNPSQRSPSHPYISGDTFRCFCDFVIDETKMPFEPNKVKNGDTIFIRHDNGFLDYFFTYIHPAIKARYILISHNCLCLKGINQYAKYLDNEKIIAWFGKNLIINNPKAHPIPVGIANNFWPHGNTEILSKFSNKPNSKKNIFLYMNFCIGNINDKRGKIRSRVYNMFSNKRYCHKSKPKNFENYLQDLSRSKFVLSPEGMGIDCHRTWEAMLVGSIPIIKSSKLDHLFKNLPVLIISNWKEITKEFLDNKYEEIHNKKYNLKKLYADYWLKKISDLKNKEYEVNISKS